MDADFFEKKYNSLSEKEKTKFKDFKDKFDALSEIEKKTFSVLYYFTSIKKLRKKCLAICH